jgi:DNA-binding beta-propeller fold protein YncE
LVVRGVAIPLLVLGAALGGCNRDPVSLVSQEPLPTTSAFGEVGTSPGQFVYPRCIDADADSLWVIDKSARVQRLDPKTGRGTAVWTMPEYSQGKPVGITIAPRPASMGHGDAIYIADTHCHRVMIYEAPAQPGAEPKLLGSFGEYGNGPGQFIYPTDVAVLPTADGKHAQRLYVGEYGDNDRISVYDASCRFLFSFGKLGSGPGVEFNRPQSLAIDARREELYVTDACNHRVGIFTLEGELVRWHGSPETAGSGPEQLCYPYGLCALGDGTALVTEYGNHRVRHMDLQTGSTLRLLGVPGVGKGELVSPWGVTVIGNTAYVLDSGNARVQAFPAPRQRRTAQREVPG